MIQVYADGVLAYDNRMEEYDLQGLKITTGLNKGGTAEIVMPHNHPAYNLFTGYKTVVEIYRDGVLRFRGRALYPTDNFTNQRTVVCEGEFCFLQDAISRPYLYQAEPAAIFSAVIAEYNAQVEPFKQFKVGTITVTDANDYLRLESENAETIMATINKLTTRCGGYIVFNNDADGNRQINWLAQVGKYSTQTIELGENLLDVTRSASNTKLATVVIPYGAKKPQDLEYGARLTIEEVNGGLDYIQDDEAVARYGRIVTTAVWDDVTQPENLLRKARQYLDERKLVVTSLKLNALDLSYVDKSVDSYEVGDLIHVRTKAHRIDDYFQLVERTEDFINPVNSNIVLGKELTSLTGLDVAGDNNSQSEIRQLVADLKKDYEANQDQTIELTRAELIGIIKQTEADLLLEISKTYVKKGEVDGEFITDTALTARLLDYITDDELAAYLVNIENTSNEGLLATYTLTFKDGQTRTFTVTKVPGPEGPAGPSPYIGENGNWWVGDEDTGTPATPESGDVTIDEVDASKIIFDETVYTAYAVGNIELVHGVGEIAIKGESLLEREKRVWSKKIAPETTDPSVEITFNKAGSYEAGSTVSPSYEATFKPGAYSYDDDTGVELKSWSVTDTNGGSKASGSGSFTSFTVTENTYYTITATAEHTAGNTPHYNTGEDYPDGAIEEGPATATSRAVTGYRNSFYGTLTHKDTLTSDIIRGIRNGDKAGKSGKNLYKGSKFSITVPEGALRVVIAYPATLGDLAEVKDVNGLGSPITGSFNLIENPYLVVKGAGSDAGIEYRVYYLDFAEPNDEANTYEVTI